MSDTDPNPLWHLAEKVWAEADGKVIRLDAVGVIYSALMARDERAAKIIEDFASGRTMTGDAVKARKVPSQTSVLMAQLIRGEV